MAACCLAVILLTLNISTTTTTTTTKGSVIIDKSKLGVYIHCVNPPVHFFVRQKLFLRETLCYLWGTMPPQWSPCFLVLPMLLVWHYITQWSSGTSPVLLTRCYAMPVVI